MIKVECVSCKSAYDVDERRIPAAGMKMRCPKCSTSFVIGTNGSVQAAAQQPSPPSAAARPAVATPGVAASAFAKPNPSPGLPQPSAAGAFAAAKPAGAFGQVPGASGGGNPRQTLLGAAPADNSAAAPPTNKSEHGTMLGVAAPGSRSLANVDLPALKPAPKSATPWGSLAPPSSESKLPPAPRAPGPALPKALGTPNSPPLAASAGAFGPKPGNAAAAFGVAAAKQTMLGAAAARAPEPAVDSLAQPAAAAAKAPPAAEQRSATGFELPFVELPAPKQPGPPFAGNTNALKAPSDPDPDPDPDPELEAELELEAEAELELPDEEPFVDLPVAKPAIASPFGAGGKPTATQALVDLPALKPAAPKAPLAPPPTAAAKLEPPAIDRPAPKPSALKPGLPAPAKALALEAPLADLPAPKPVLGKPGFAPAPSAGRPNLLDASMIDLPAPKPTAAKPDAHIDLLAPKPAAAKPPLAAPLKAGAAGQIDLPALKAKLPLPAAGRSLAPDPAEPELPALKGQDFEEIDLPTLKGSVDLPATKTSIGEIDLPTLKGSVDLPAPKGIADLPTLKGSVDLPAPKGSVDLPAIKGSVDLPAIKGSVDLPATKGSVDLPAPRGIADLPAPRGIADLPAPRGIADLPAPRGIADLPSPKGAGFGDLDLPIPKAFGAGAEDEVSFGDLELPDGPHARTGTGSFGDIELPSPRAGADLVPPKARTYQGVGIPQGKADDETSFGNLELGSPIPPYPDDELRLDDVQPDDLLTLKHDPNAAELDLGSLPPALRGDGGDDAYGEAGLEGTDESMEFGIAEGEGFALPPEILRRQRGEDTETIAQDKGKRALHVLLGVALLLLVVGGAGAALGFTDYGFFGSYVLEQYLPEAGNAKFARDAIERAERSAAPDTYKGVRRSLVQLGESRHEAGLNRELLTRSLLHEALYMVRFGADTGSSAHVAAILRRLEERAGLAPGMSLARAADAARRGEYRETESQLRAAASEAPSDPYVALLAGEVALRQGKLADAEQAFMRALKLGGSARAQWGVARVAIARNDDAAQRAAIEATLKLSPQHAEARIADARTLFRAGKEEAAIQELRQALGLDALDDQFIAASKLAKAQGYSLLGHIHEQRSRLHLARTAYEDALAADPYLVEALLGSGRVLLRERRFNDALARFEAGLNVAQKSPSSVVLTGRKADDEARLGQSRAQLALGRAPDAKANLLKLNSQNPEDPEIVLALGQAEEALLNKASAEGLYRKAIELAPASFSGYLALSQYYFKQNQPDRASETLNDAASKVEENAEMRRMLGQSELARNRLDSAVHEFKRAIELDPQDLDARFGLAVSYRRSNELEQARALFEQIAQRDPQFAGLTLEHGQLLEAQGAYDQAIENYRSALAKDANDTALLLRLGAAQAEAGRLDEAEQTLDKVIHQTPNSADAEYYIGRVAFARGRGPDALTHFDRALALDNTQSTYHLYAARAALEMANLGRTLDEAEAALARDAKLGDAYWVRGVVRVRSGAVKDALKDALRALELKPSRIEAHALMAECYDELRQLPLAIDAYRTALAADPKRGEWWYKLGRVCLDQGARGDAALALESAIKLGDALDPRPYWLPDSYRLAGEAARALNNRKAAVSFYKRYLELSPPGALDRADVTKLLRDWNVELE